MDHFSYNKNTVDFGNITKGVQVTGDIELINLTNNRIELTTWAGCGCTTPTLSSSSVGPGKKVYLHAHFNTAGKSGVQEKKFGINYKYNGVPHSISFTLKANIIK